MLDTRHNFYAKLQSTKNFLLIKDDVGKSKPITRNLPSDDFSYGIKIKKDREDAGAVISSWRSTESRPKESLDQNFKKLNILSIGEKFVTAPQQRAFRKTAKNQRINSEEPKMVEDNRKTYGMPLRPSTPIKAVLGGFYGNVSYERKHKAYSEKVNTAYLQGRREHSERVANNEVKQLFKMKRFLKIKAKTCTRRPKSVL